MSTPNEGRRATGSQVPVNGTPSVAPGLRKTGPRDPAGSPPAAPADSGVSPAAGSGVAPAVPAERVAAVAPTAPVVAGAPGPHAPAPIAPQSGLSPASASAAPPDTAQASAAGAAPAMVRRGTNRQGAIRKTGRRNPAGEAPPVDAAAVRSMGKNNKILLGLLGAAVVVVIALFAVVALHTSSKPVASAPIVNPGSDGGLQTSLAGPVTGGAHPGGAPTQPQAPAEPLTDRQKLVADYDAYARDHAGDFLGRREKLDQLMTVFDDADWIECVVARVDRLKASADRAATERVATVIQKSNACAEADDYAGAFEALDSFPEQLSRTDAAFKLNFQRRKIGEMAHNSVKNAENRARKAMEAGKFDEALDAYKSLLASKYPPIMQDVRVRVSEVKDAKTRGLHPGENPAPSLSGVRRFYMADSYAGLKEAVDLYDDQVNEAIHGFMIDAKGLKENLEKFPRSAVLYYCLCVVEARDGDRVDAEWALAQARRLADDSPAFESRALSAEARMFMNEMKLEDAQDKCAAALKADSANPEAMFVKGLCEYYEYYQLRGIPGTQDAARALAEQMNGNFKSAAALDPAYSPVLKRLRLTPRPAEGDAVDAGDEDDPYRYKGNGGNPYLAAVVVIHRETEFGTALGTGWVVASKDGVAYVITNHHVVGNGKTFKVKYRLPTVDSVSIKETSEAKVLGIDDVYD
ncbi:MAG TPA: hypothetical protein VL860_05845, partial [Planctomycetota bacterium]|nr:hypothetical protein [Planctomycetota bacterium]